MRKKVSRITALLLAVLLLSQSFSVLAEDTADVQQVTTSVQQETTSVQQETTDVQQEQTEQISAAEEDSEAEEAVGAEAMPEEAPEEILEEVPEAAAEEAGEIEELSEENPSDENAAVFDDTKDEEDGASEEEQDKEVRYVLQYQTHSQTIGWQDWRQDGELAGTTGQSKRLEAISIKVMKETADPEDPEAVVSDLLEGAVEYRTHCQTYGDMDWVKDGAIAGTTGQSKRLEAIQIRLTGELAETYDIYYQVHCSRFGNMGWAKNGEWAGTSGYSKAIEAITIRLIEKGSTDVPAQTTRSYITPTNKGTLTYRSHVQTYGWLDSVADGAVSGTQGQSKRMEALEINLENPKDADGNEIEGSVEYRAHVQTYGWQDWVKDGAIAGTTGQSKRLEAVQIRLTGALAEQYDIYYRAHSSHWGTLGWAKNGESAGTIGYSRAIESIEIKLAAKDSEAAPAQDARASLDKANIGSAVFTASIAGSGWQNPVGNKGTLGTAGQDKALEAVKLQVESGQEGTITGLYSGGISYKVHMQSSGWQDAVSDGAEAGAAGKGKRLEAIQISLTGELAKYCDVYYRANVEAYGWLGWAKNGQIAGTTNCSYRMAALQIVIQPKTAAAPGSNANYYKDTRRKVRYENAINTILNSAGRDLYACYSWVVHNLKYQTLPIPMAPPEGYTYEEGYAIYGVENRRGNCYCFAAAFAGAAKALGYDARYIEGKVGLARGGTGPHGWVEVVMNGTTYVCDPEGEYELGRNFYMVTYGSASLQYYK